MFAAAACLAAATLLSSGPLYIGTEKNLKVAVPRIEAAIEVDGVLSEGP